MLKCLHIEKEDIMSNKIDPATRTSTKAWDIDAGLRAHMQRVYNFMALGLGITGITAYLTSLVPIASWHVTFRAYLQLSFLCQKAVLLAVHLVAFRVHVDGPR